MKPKNVLFFAVGAFKYTIDCINHILPDCARSSNATPRNTEPVNAVDNVGRSMKGHAVAMVIPAQEDELIRKLRDRGNENIPIAPWLAGQLKDKSCGFWYGIADLNDKDFSQIEQLVGKAEQKPYPSTIDFVICLIYLNRKNADFEAETIGRRYDGIQSLGDNVEKIRVSPQLSPDKLKDISFIHI